VLFSVNGSPAIRVSKRYRICSRFSSAIIFRFGSVGSAVAFVPNRGGRSAMELQMTIRAVKMLTFRAPTVS